MYISIYQSSNKQPPSIIYFILNSKNFDIVLVSSNQCFLYAIRINLRVRNTALYGLNKFESLL